MAQCLHVEWLRGGAVCKGSCNRCAGRVLLEYSIEQGARLGARLWGCQPTATARGHIWSGSAVLGDPFADFLHLLLLDWIEQQPGRHDQIFCACETGSGKQLRKTQMPQH